MTSARTREESPNAASARRCRGIFAEEMLSQSEVARRMGIRQQALNRRLNGTTAMTIDDVVAIAKVTGLNVLWMVTGEGDAFGPAGCLVGPPGPDDDDLVRHQGLEPRTR